MARGLADVTGRCVRRLDDLVDDLVGVGQSREQHLVGAGGDGHAAVEEGVEQPGVGGLVGGREPTS